MPLANMDFSALQDVRLDPGLTIATLKSMPRNVLWQMGMPCPNRVEDEDKHDLNCKVCDGTGFYYEGGTNQQMLVSGVGLKQMFQSFGRFDAGTAMITALPEVKLSWWDRVTFLESTVRYSQVVTRAAKGLVDRLKYVPVKAVMLIDSHAQSYVAGTDFTISPSAATITWGSRRPEPGAFYTFVYLIRPRYVVIDLMHQTRDLPKRVKGGGVVAVEYPVMAMGQLDFLIGTSESKK